MKGTDMDFDKFDKDFDSHFKTMRRFAIAMWFIGAGVTCTVIGFVGWVVVKLLQHFAVI